MNPHRWRGAGASRRGGVGAPSGARGYLITLSGPDGVGKSTQAELLVQRLRSHGRAARCLWFRPGYSRELDLARSLVRVLSRRVLPTADQPEQRARVFQRPGVSRAWLGMALGDTALQLGLKLRLRLARGETVVCDRYLLDARLDLTLRFPHLEGQLAKSWGVVASCCPAPDAAFVLKLSSDLTESRLAGKTEPFPEPLRARETRRDAYAALERSGAALVVDANHSPEVVHREIWKQVASLFAL